MQWNNLKSNKCPLCSSDLTVSSAIRINCSKCPFVISQKRFGEICTSLNERALEQREEKQGFDRFDDFNEPEEDNEDAF